MPLSQEWLQFVIANVLHYTTILGHLLDRIAQTDLNLRLVDQASTKRRPSSVGGGYNGGSSAEKYGSRYAGSSRSFGSRLGFSNQELELPLLNRTSLLDLTMVWKVLGSVFGSRSVRNLVDTIEFCKWMGGGVHACFFRFNTLIFLLTS
jgi:hypothetical protein